MCVIHFQLIKYVVKLVDSHCFYHYLVADNDYIRLEDFHLSLSPENDSVEVPVNITSDRNLELNEQLIMHLELLLTSQTLYIGVNNVPLVIQDDDCKYECGIKLEILFVSHM